MRKAFTLLTLSALALASPALSQKGGHGGGNPHGDHGGGGGGNPHGGGGNPHGGGGNPHGGVSPHGDRGNPGGGGPQARQQSPQMQHGPPMRGGGHEVRPMSQSQRQGRAATHAEARQQGQGHGRQANQQHENRSAQHGDQRRAMEPSRHAEAQHGHGPPRFEAQRQRQQGRRTDAGARQAQRLAEPRGQGRGNGREIDNDTARVDRGRPGGRANTGGAAFAPPPNRFAGQREVTRDYAPQHQWRRFRDARNLAGEVRSGPSPLIVGCPPGLAPSGNGCYVPDQARRIWGYSNPYENWYTYPVWYGYDDRYDWRYNDGYLYRVDPATRLITAFLPLLGGALYVDEVWPSGYDDYAVDPYYRRYYGYQGDYDYRYADGAIFAVDQSSHRIHRIVALLTGDDWVVGSHCPDGYDFYNVPPAYRDRYYDSDAAWYRYSDGYVYEIDPTTLLVRRAIELLANT